MASIALLLTPASAGADRGIGLMMASDRCPDVGISGALVDAIGRHHRSSVSVTRTAAAVAYVRAERAVDTARGLFTRTNFAGCTSLLSITEQELGRHLALKPPERLLEAHRLLAQVNLWLGICQWAAGDPQAAAASFVRSSQLPNSPVPDAQLLPPELLRDYNRAVSSPREQVSCTLDESLIAGDLLVNGKGPTVKGRTLRVPAGIHYLVMRVRCSADETAPCRRSLRLDGQPLGCKVPRPELLTQQPQGPVCISPKESADPVFVGDVARRARASAMLVAEIRERGITLRLGKAGRRDFVRQLVSNLESQPRSKQELARTVDLLLGGTVPPPPPPPNGESTAWYGKWWVWGIAGAVVVGVVITTAVAATPADHFDLVFRR